MKSAECRVQSAECRKKSAGAGGGIVCVEDSSDSSDRFAETGFVPPQHHCAEAPGRSP